MSDWVVKHQQEAFSLWRRYLALSLHFRDGSAYDYTLYGGSTNATFQTFLGKGKEATQFINLANRLKTMGVDPERFLFANARYESLHISKLLNKEALDIHKKWEAEYGTKDAFRKSVAKLIQLSSLAVPKYKTAVEVVLGMLDQNDQSWYEAIALALQKRTPDEISTIERAASNNALYKLHFDRAVRVQKIYSYLCIL